MPFVPIAVGAIFAVVGAASERVASVWPPDEASRRSPGVRTVLLAAASGVAAWGIAVQSALPWWATGVYLAMLALMVLLTATDLEQRRLPHLVLDPLILIAVVFVPFNFIEAAATVLTNDRLDPRAKIPDFKVCAVKLTPIAAPAGRDPATDQALTERGAIKDPAALVH